MKKVCCVFISLLVCISSQFLFSACNKKEYTINFMVNDNVYSTIKTEGEEILSLPDNPSLSGYQFEGWYYDKDSWIVPFTKYSLQNEKLTNDIFIYSKWKEINDTDNDLGDTNSNSPSSLEALFNGFNKNDDNYMLTVNNNIEYLDMSEVVSVSNGSSWTLCTDISANNEINSKIATLNVGDNTYYVLVINNNQDVKLYTLIIRRKPIYTINFKVDNENFTFQQVEEGEFAQIPTQCPEKLGYAFDGWDFDFDTKIMSNCEVEAFFTLIEYNINYVLCGGTNDILNPKEYNFKTSVNLKEPQKSGYTFIGWYENNDYEGYACTTIPINSIGDKVLYARWIESAYTENYKPIYTTEEFITFLSNSDNWSRNVRLFADLDFKNKNIPTIGRYDLAYSAVFDGNGFCIKNTTKSLFQYFSGTLKNLGVRDINIDKYYNKTNCVGGLVAYNENGIIMDCYTTGKIKAIGPDTTYVGGIVGYSEKGSITNCYSTATIYAEHDCGGLCHDDAYAGGIVGYVKDVYNIKTSIENIFFTGYVSAHAEYLLNYHANLIVASGIDKNVKNYYYLNSNTELVDIYSYVISNWDNKVWNLYNNNNPTLIKNSIKKRL